MEERITSHSNSKLKLWKDAQRGKGAWAEAWIPEGLRLCREAFMSLEASGSWERLLGLLVSDSGLAQPQIRSLCEQAWAHGCVPLHVSDALFAQFADTIHPQGLALALAPPVSQEVFLAGRRILILERVQDPGNLGACCRSADALGFDALILTGGGVKPNNSKALRAGMGAFFHIPVLTLPEPTEVFEKLESAGYVSLAAAIQEEVWSAETLRNYQAQEKIALWIGNEGTGLSEASCSRASCGIRLPMASRAESLNAACAASILCYLFSPLVPLSSEGGKSICKL